MTPPTPPTRQHPSDQSLVDHLAEKLDRPSSEALDRHVERCGQCQIRMAQLAATDHWWAAAGGALDNLSPPPKAGTPSQPPAPAGQLWHVEFGEVQNYLHPTDDPHKIGRIGSYEIIGIVGAGATAVVLKAFDAALHRNVAIKLLRPSLASSPIARHRFAREARSAASIVHANVVEIYGVDQIDGLPYLVMAYVPGQSLARRIQTDWPMSTDTMLHIACQVAEGLAAAHQKSLVHRDVKPSNILMGEGVERLQLTDFGLARAIDDVGLTRSGTLAGTPEYMSPEQARGEPVDYRSDLYSLGVVMHAMCTGAPPFTADSCYAVLRRIVEDTPQPIHQFNPDVPDWLVRLIAKLMHKDPSQRPIDAEAVASDLKRCLSHHHDRTEPLPEHLRPGLSKTRRAVGRGMLTLIIALMVLALIAWALTAGAAGRWATGWPTETTRSPPRTPTKSAPRVILATPAPPSPATPWHDGTTELLRDLQRQWNDYERDFGPITP